MHLPHINTHAHHRMTICLRAEQPHSWWASFRKKSYPRVVQGEDSPVVFSK